MLDVEVIGIDGTAAEPDPGVPTAVELEELCALALASADIDEGHLAIEFVDEERIQDLNRRFRDRDSTTDVLSFGVDEDARRAPPTCARRSSTAPCTSPGWITRPTTARCSRCSPSSCDG